MGLRWPGFTLIEVMICIAILAIVGCVLRPVESGLRSLTRETDYRYALANAQSQLETLRREPFESLPPEVVNVEGPVARPHHSHVIPGTLRCLDAKGQKLPWSATAAGVEVRPGHPRVVLDYEYATPDVEDHTVGPDGSLPLWNTPVQQILGIRVQHGSASAPLRIGRVGPDGTMHLANEAGHVVEVEYLGSRVVTAVRGQFLDTNLQPVPYPTSIKLLTIEEAYAGSANHMKLSLLRMGDHP